MARYVQGIAVVLGVLVILSFTMIMIAAAPGRETLKAFGSPDVEPISGLTSLYNTDSLGCAFQEMHCDLAGLK